MWPIEERPVAASTVPGERTSPTQPFPTKPAAFDLQGSTEENLLDFTPELRKRALEQLNTFAHGPVFTPLSLEKSNIMMPGIAGGANWGGAGFDPETGVLYVPSRTAPTVITLMPVDPKQGNMRYQRAAMGIGAGLDTIDGLSIFKPPYSRITAIDLNTGEHRWMSAVGDGPRDHPLLKGLNVPPLGERLQNISVLVTKTLVFVGTVPVADTQTPPGVQARKLIYVFDKSTGARLHDIELEAFSAAAPMTYMHRGKQYIAVATGMGPNSEWMALTLPSPSSAQ